MPFRRRPFRGALPSPCRFPTSGRLSMIRRFADKLAAMDDIRIINAVYDKSKHSSGDEIFERAWIFIIQRFENTIRYRNFPGPHQQHERGMIFPDNTGQKKLTHLIRRMRRYNPIPNQPEYGIGTRNIGLEWVIEDPNYRTSEHSHFIQAADLTAFLLYQHFAPSAYMKKKSGRNYLLRLKPVLCSEATKKDPLGLGVVYV
jgi:hypothetical protein